MDYRSHVTWFLGCEFLQTLSNLFLPLGVATIWICRGFLLDWYQLRNICRSNDLSGLHNLRSWQTYGSLSSADLPGRYFPSPDSVSLASGPNNLLWRGRSEAPDCIQISVTGGLSTGLHRSGHNGTAPRYPVKLNDTNDRNNREQSKHWDA